MPVDQTQLSTDLGFIRELPQWRSGDETQRRELARQISIESAASGQDPEQHQALTAKLWEEADPRGWARKSVEWVGGALETIGKSAVAFGPAYVMAASDAVGLTDTGSGMRLRRGVADLGNAAIQTVKQFAPNNYQQQMGETLDALKEDIHKNAVPASVTRWLAGDEAAGQDPTAQPWIKALTDGLGGMAAKADTRLQLNPGFRKDAVTTKSEDDLRQSWLNSDRNPARAGVQDDGTQMGAKDFLADYLVTRDPQSWQQFVDRVTETESQHKTRVGRSLTGEAQAMNIAGQMGLQGDLLKRGLDMQTSPIDMATAALPLLRGTRLLKATMAGAEAGSIGRRIAMGAGEEALQEGITQKLQDARASNADVLEAAAMGAIGSGAIEGGMAGTGALINRSRSPISTANAVPGTAPGATAPGGTTGPASTPPGSGGQPAPGYTGGQTNGAPNAGTSTSQASPSATSPGVQTGGTGSVIGEGGMQTWGDGNMPVNPTPIEPSSQGQSLRLQQGAQGSQTQDQIRGALPMSLPAPQDFASVNEGSPALAADKTGVAPLADAGSTPAAGAEPDIARLPHKADWDSQVGTLSINDASAMAREGRMSAEGAKLNNDWVEWSNRFSEKAWKYRKAHGEQAYNQRIEALKQQVVDWRETALAVRKQMRDADLKARVDEASLRHLANVLENSAKARMEKVAAAGEVGIATGMADAGSTPATGAGVIRDANKPEQMTPEEAVKAYRFGKQGGKGAYMLMSPDGSTMNMVADQQRGALTKEPKDIVAAQHRSDIENMLAGRFSMDGKPRRVPVSAAAVDAYGIKLPEGYVKQGDLYVYKPDAGSTPAAGADVNTLSQDMPPSNGQGILDASPTVTGSNAQTGAEMPVPAARQGEGSTTGYGADVVRDASKPEQMTPEEAVRIDLSNRKAVGLVDETLDEMVSALVKAGDIRERALRDMVRLHSGGHEVIIENALKDSRSVSAQAVDDYGVKLPQGYVRQGELYVYKPDAGSTPAAGADELSRRQSAASAFERAMLGDDTAYEDLDAMLRARYGQGQPVSQADELGRAVYTQAAFEQLFEQAFAAQDFDSILDAMKQSDRAVYTPLLKRFFKEQADNPASAMKAEWMRHVFAGTRPPNAAAPRAQAATASPPPPRQGTPPPSSAGTSTPPPPRQSTPPRKPPQSPPPPPRAPRIPVAPITGRLAKSNYQIINDYAKAIGKLFQTRRLKKSQLGVYRPGTTMTANRFEGDLDTAAHELAGHWTDDKHGLGKPWLNQPTSPYDTELANFWIHGSPSTNVTIQRAEGIAEWLRAYVMNPQAAMAAAPKFARYVQQTLPADAMKALNNFSDDVRTWAGENALRRTSLNIRSERPSVRERLSKALWGDGSEFGKTWADSLREKFDDSFAYAVKGWQTALKLQGRDIKSIKPSENFDLLLRWLSGHDSRFSDQLMNGLTPLKTTQVQGAKGLEVHRLTDPVTGEAMSLPWLLGAFDNTNEQTLKQDQSEAAALMVAERTLERAQAIDDEATAKLAALGPNATTKQRNGIMAEAEQAKKQISGIGAGMMTDQQAARETVAAMNQDPNKARRLREAARRYRAWANANLELLVESGRMSREQVDAIKKANTQYVDMHRLSEEFEIGRHFEGLGGRSAPGATKEVMRRYKGSTLAIDNVYASLLKQTEAIQHEAMRNRTMQTFVQQLESARGLYEGDPVQIDRIGSLATSEDRNTIKVYRDGKLQYWKLDPDIHTALKGVGELGSHEFIEIIGNINSVAKWCITHSPPFMIRNPIRDTFQRPVVSDSGGRPWDILGGYTDADKQRLMAFGGGMFGHYGKDKYAWDKELERGMKELAKDKRNILLDPRSLIHAWDKIGENSEALGRVAEFRKAFDKGKKLGYTDDEAALYAAGEARGLLDFAKMGSWMRVINKIIPFSNAAVRGLSRSAHAFTTDPVGFATRWTMFVALPTLAVRMLAKQMGKEVEDEYQQLPAGQRDFFYNIKLGRYWLRIPKPHELGVMAGGVERLLSREMGEKNSFDGYGGSVLTAGVPVNDIASLLGPLKAPAEIVFNRDTFRDRDIIPVWEKDLKLELRKGASNSSMAGQAVSKMLGVDPRNVDHLFGSFGGLGQSLIDFTKPDRKLGESALKGTGLALPPVSSQSKDYQWVMDWAKSNGKLTDKHVMALRKLTQQIYAAPTVEEADNLAKILREQATAIRQQVTGR